MQVELVQFLLFLGACFVILLIVWRRRPETKIQTSEWHVRWALGVIGLTGTMIFQYIAFDIGPITEVNIIAYSWPLIAALIMIFGRTAENSKQLIILSLLGFGGVLLLIGGDKLGQQWQIPSPLGVLFAVLSAVCMAAFSFGMTRTQSHADDVLLPGALVGLAIAAVWCLFGNTPWNLSWTLWAGLYLGVGPMGLGYLFWALAMQRDSSGKAALFGFLTPVLSTVLLLASGQNLTLTSSIGAVIVLITCALASKQAWISRYA